MRSGLRSFRTWSRRPLRRQRHVVSKDARFAVRPESMRDAWTRSTSRSVHVGAIARTASASCAWGELHTSVVHGVEHEREWNVGAMADAARSGKRSIVQCPSNSTVKVMSRVPLMALSHGSVDTVRLLLWFGTRQGKCGTRALHAIPVPKGGVVTNGCIPASPLVQ